MFRRARWLLLLAIILIAGFVAAVYRIEREAQRRQRPKLSPPLPVNTSSTAEQWEWEIKEGDLPKARIRARNVRQISRPASLLLEGVEMRIFEPEGGKYDLVKSARASYDQAAGRMYSDGDVEITMNIPQEGASTAKAPSAGRLLTIRSAGVTFEAQTTKVWTERDARFVFDRGEGESTGAIYDPTTHELRMDSNVHLRWRSKDGGDDRTIDVEAGRLTYRELEKQIHLEPWAKMTRGNFHIEAGNTLVQLVNGEISLVDAQQAHGTDELPGRRLDYAANHMLVHFGARNVVQKIEGAEQAKLVSTTAGGPTTVTSRSVDLDFDTSTGDSVLARAVANGQARVESVPAAKPGTPPPPVRVLTSELIELRMRPGGKEIDQVRTEQPAQADFLPQRPGEKRRRLNGDRLTITYGADNMVESCQSTNVVTRTETPQKDGKVSVGITRSQWLDAKFDPKTGQMTRINQWGNFEYEEGSRRAKADSALFDSPKDVIVLTKNARLWDDTGSTTADTIMLAQSVDTTIAEGHVASTRLPDSKVSSGGMIESGQPLQARADHMTVSDRNRRILYEGNAMLWQGASRLHATSVLINRAERRLEAKGDVVSTIPDERGGKPARPDSPAIPAVTTIHAPSLVYTDADKLALFTGGTTLQRAQLNVSSRDLRAWFRQDKDAQGTTQSRLDRLFADGAVRIDEHAPGRTRTFSAEHCEYYLDEERMLLTGGAPLVTDSKYGTTRGQVITWLSREDRLIVDNTGSGPSVSRVRRDKR
jgi:lipopolysaccharide export system protein LptA